MLQKPSPLLVQHQQHELPEDLLLCCLVRRNRQQQGPLPLDPTLLVLVLQGVLWLELEAPGVIGQLPYHQKL